MRTLIGTLLLAAGVGSPAAGQHATAFDVQDGRRVYEGLCAACHGPDGNLISGIDFSRGVFRRTFSDDELAATIMAGIPNTPMPPNPTMRRDEALRVVEYLRSMSEGRETKADGDATRGRALFEGKGECTDCHAVRGVGSRVGPDLTHLASRRMIAAGSLENTPANLASWITAPQLVKPGTQMPATPLAPEDLAVLIQYLTSLR